MNLPKIIIDTDPGHDDSLAIMLLEKSKMFDILALTTVAGNTTIQNATNNARYVLDLLGSPIPIYSGCDQPLNRKLITANVHGENGLAGADIQKIEPLSNNAPQKIIDLVRANPHQISILVIGPETNIATAFIQDPELPTLIKEIIIMGGAISVPGNKNRVAEFNIFVDPEAADIVFRSSTPKVLVPLDVCNDVALFLDDFEHIHDSSLYKPIMSMMKHYIKGIERFENASGAIMYDPLAAYYLINPSAYKIEKKDIVVETKGEHTFGMTVADKRHWGQQTPNVTVAISVNRPKFVEDFISILNS